MKRILLLSLCVFSLFGCTSPKRYAMFVRDHYKNIETNRVNQKPNIIVTANSLPVIDTVVTTKKKNAFFIPAIVIFAWNNNIACTLSPAIPVNMFANTFNKYSDSLELGNKIKGQRLEVNIDALPSQFTFTESGGVVLLVLSYGMQAVVPTHTNLAATYKLYNGNVIVKKGTVTIEDDAKYMVNNIKTVRKITNSYLDRYERQIRKLAVLCAAQISNELP